jgi:cupin superfamily acireductone dioxygenase involved in methionine salvage
MNFFDFLNAINDSKKDLLKEDPLSEKDYAPFMVNRGLSYFHDTIMHANEMNKYSSIPKNWQFDFYRISVPKRRRFSKWHKKDTVEQDVQLIVQEYGYSTQKALQVLDIFNEDELQKLREKYKTGGR